MATLLSTMQTALTALVQAYDSVPTTTQYQQAVEDAIDDFGQRFPLVGTATLSLVADTADYDLPDDFLRVISLMAPTVSAQYQEEWEVKDADTITFYPTPTTAHSLTLRYCARYAASGSPTTYTDIGETESRVLLHEARAICLGMIADQVARDAWTYTEGEQAVNKTKQSSAFRKMAAAAHEDYLRALKALPPRKRKGTVAVSRSGD